MELDSYLSIDRDSGVPLATQISQQLTWLIANGRLAQGEMLPPISELASILGVNVHTVRAGFQQLKADGLLDTRRGSRAVVRDHVPSQLARNGADYRTYTIGVLLPTYSTYYDDYLRGIASAAVDEAWLPFICETHDYDPETVERYMKLLASRNVDGIVVTHCETADMSKMVGGLHRKDGTPPTVFVDSAQNAFPRVEVDREEGAYQATRHLLSHGHEAIALVTAPAHWNLSAQLRRGYERALIDVGAPIVSDLVEETKRFTLEEGARAVQRMLDLPAPPTAVLTAGDVLALGAMHDLKKRGYRIPEDVAVVGFGEIAFAALSDPPLTTVRLDAAAMGKEAVRLLRETMSGVVRPTGSTIEAELVVRASCGCT